MQTKQEPLTLKDPISDKVPVLDHGYVQAIEAWGCDERIIEAARMSTGKGFQGWGPTCKDCHDAGDGDPDCLCSDNGKHTWVAGDEKLLRYLYEHRHSTPFEMAGLVIEVQAPIFVFREWHRHRTQSYNEMSARYTPLPDLNYIPTVERLVTGSQATNNKQAQGSRTINIDEAEEVRSRLLHSYKDSQDLYKILLEVGTPKELARLPVPVARYSRMRASTNLRNWLAFLTLRMDLAAQYEIRLYANQVGEFISQLYPRTWELFVEGRQAK